MRGETSATGSAYPPSRGNEPLADDFATDMLNHRDLSPRGRSPGGRSGLAVTIFGKADREFAPELAVQRPRDELVVPPRTDSPAS